MNDITKIKVDGEPESSYKLFPKNREFEKRAGGNTGSQSSVQSDWNQNDETQPDYVKNRPFYMGAPVETVLVEESTVSFADAGGPYEAQFQSTFVATVGEAYKVYWDGSAYECTCADFNGNGVIGNLSIGGQGSDTGEPFIMIVHNAIGIQIYTADTSASHTFSISVFAPEVVKIDQKYLPSPLIIDATHLPTNNSWWGELREKIDSAYKNRREILLNVYGDNSFVLPCVSWVNDTATFIYAKNDFTNLCIYILTAFTNDGGSLVKRIIAMQAEPM